VRRDRHQRTAGSSSSSGGISSSPRRSSARLHSARPRLSSATPRREQIQLRVAPAVDLDGSREFGGFFVELLQRL